MPEHLPHHGLETQPHLVKTCFVVGVLSWVRYLGRLCTRRKEASFLIFRVTVLLGLSHKKREMRRQARLISRQGLLDLVWYRARYEQFAGAFVSPVVHYLRSGANLGCDPNPLFYTKWYSEEYRSSIPKGLNPLIHYIRKGVGKGCDPSPLFDTRAYLVQHPEMSRDGLNPLSHHLKNGFNTASLTPPVGRADWPSATSYSTDNRGHRVVYVSGEPGTPGHIYRVEMYANALTTRGYDVHVIGVNDVPHSIRLLEAASAIVMWRTVWSGYVERIYSIAKKSGAKVVYDIDDLMIDPALARADVSDEIRFLNLDEKIIANHYALARKSALAADYCSSPTEVLTSALRLLGKPGFVLPNGFDEQTYLCTRRAVAKRRAEPSDGLVRLGYAGGTCSHQKDFSLAVPAIARILRQHPECRLVLFRVEQGERPHVCLDPDEYPELVGLEAQIEWLPFRPLRELPNAIARFDINLAPLEHGNLFCEAKSELKYFEAALAEIPTVASPSIPFAAAIRHGVTGFLARNDEEWYTVLEDLVCDPQKRIQIGKTAFDDVYWRYGPERRAELIGNVMDQMIYGGERAADAFQLELFRRQAPGLPAPQIPEYDVLFESGSRAESAVAVVISLFNHGDFVEEALESAKAQTLAERDLIVVDDCSTDDSASIVNAWLQRNASAFSHAALLKNKVNSGLAAARNAGFSFTDAPYIMVLDADNVLNPNCLERCLAEITRTGAAAAYPMIRKFGEGEGIMGNDDWSPARLAISNYIDAMALVRRSAWARVGGYEKVATVGGWQDYHFWCGFVGLGLRGCWVREVLANYRVHGKSMLHTSTDLPEIKQDLVEQMRFRHPWVDLPQFERSSRV